MSTLERIRARADGAVSKLTNAVFTMHDGLAAVGDRVMLLDAVQAVLDAHVPKVGATGETHCAGCHNARYDCEGDHVWPCPTVTAIMATLDGTP